jgi:hypothetical protein
MLVGAVNSAPINHKRSFMAKKIKKLPKGAKDIGGTKMPYTMGKHEVELDPNNDLTLIEHPTKGQEAYYKGQKIPYLDYYEKLADREIKVHQGKSVGSKSLGVFSGWGEGTLNKPYNTEKN